MFGFFILWNGSVQHRFAVKLQKRFVDLKSLPDFPSARGLVDND